MKINENIKKLRIQKRITQKLLADMLNVSTAAVCKWESNSTNPSLEMLVSLAKIFSVSINELMGYEEFLANKFVDEIIINYESLINIGDYKNAYNLISNEAKKTLTMIK